MAVALGSRLPRPANSTALTARLPIAAGVVARTREQFFDVGADGTFVGYLAYPAADLNEKGTSDDARPRCGSGRVAARPVVAISRSVAHRSHEACRHECGRTVRVRLSRQGSRGLRPGAGVDAGSGLLSEI